MTCIVCGGDLIEKTTTYTAGQDDSVLIVKNVPANVCSQCGEEYINADVCKDLEKIERDAKESATEIYVTNYPVTTKVA